MADEPPDRLMSPDGRSGWFAYAPVEDEAGSEDAWEPPAEHSVIRLMGDHTVTVPLWSEVGLMFDEAAELVRAMGVSEELASDLVEWARAWDVRAGQPDHDAQAARLVRRLRRELDGRFTVVFHP